MADALNVQVRESRGKRESRRLRRNGSIPAILYGHGESNVALAVSAEEVGAVIRHGGRVVELRGGVNEKALIRDLQWDTYGTGVLHLDLARVSEHERISVEVPVDLRGEAPGSKQGGVVEHVLHEVEIECEAIAIPEKLEININTLNVGDQLTAGDLHLPAGVVLLTEADTVIVQCVEPVEEEDIAPTEGAAEPEVIGRKAEEEGEE